MKSFWIMAMMCLSSSVAMADATASFNGHQISLTEAQVAELQKEAAEYARQNGKPTTIVEEVTQYAQLGQALGAGLAGTAKELGIAVNDFANTPLGKIATVIIVFKLIGMKFVGIVFGFFWFITLIPLWIYFFKRICLYKNITYEETPNESGKIKKTKTVSFYNKGETDGTKFLMFSIFSIICVVGIAIIF